MTQPCDILLIGTGFFAEVMINDLSTTATRPLFVVVAGRNAERLAWLCLCANARAAAHRRPVVFQPAAMRLDSVDSIAEALRPWSASVVVQSASLQSPWTIGGAESPWARLVAEAGFGFTLALQALLPLRTAQALQSVGSDAAFVNTCYPDAVNPLLHARGLPIACGVGNIAIFSSVVAAAFEPAVRDQIRVLASHYHLLEWRLPPAHGPRTPIRVWQGDTELRDLPPSLAHVHLPYRDLNLLSGSTAVPVLLALSGSGELRSHAPGPGGRLGGYPVRVTFKRVELDLPATLDERGARQWIEQHQLRDGVMVSPEGQVTYSPAAREAIARHDASVAEGFAAADLERALADLTALRTRLGG